MSRDLRSAGADPTACRADQPTARRIFVAAVCTLCAFRCCTSVAIDVDIWHEMSLAREAFQLGYVPWQDSFAYTPTVNPAVHHEWGAGVIAYLLAITTGWYGIAILRYLLLFATAVICWRIAAGQGASTYTIGTLSLIAIMLVSAGCSPVRAQMYSFFFAALLLAGLSRDRQGQRWWLWLWPIAHLVWLNLHAGFLVGIGFLAAHWLEQLCQRRRHWHLVGLGCLLLALIVVNPYGPHYYRYLFDAVTMPRPLISEWVPLWAPSERTELVVFSLSIVIVIYSASQLGWRNCDGLWVIAVSAVYSLMAARMLPFFAIAWLSYVPGYVEQTDLGSSIHRMFQKYHSAWRLLWPAAIVLMLFVMIMTGRWQLIVPGFQVPGSLCYPVGAVDYLEDVDFEGNLMVPYDYGAYVSWKLHPKVKVSIDSRYEVAYQAGLLEEHTAFYEGTGDWRTILERYQADAVLVPRGEHLGASVTERRLSSWGDESGSAPWRLRYRDDVYALFLRGEAAGSVVDRTGIDQMGSFP